MSDEIHLRKRDFRVDWFHGKGAGGQHRNKHANCCRITHLATGMVETGQSHKNQPSNQREAFNKLARRLIDFYRKPNATPEINQERIRTYHAERNEVKDHASGFTQPYKLVVGGQHLDDMIEARLKVKRAEELEE